ncbi:MAG: hypothetical protein Q9157_008644, partial [Trypethelium eluteriae]
MNDLSGLQWQDSSSKNAYSTDTRQHPTGQALNPTPPISRGPTPSTQNLPATLSVKNASSKGPAKSSSPANDSFASLLSSNATKSSNSLSLQERQKQLQEEKARQQDEQRKKYEAQYGFGKSDVWNSLGSGKSTPQQQSGAEKGEEEDILSAFSSTAPVNVSSYFPPPDATTNHLATKTVLQNDGRRQSELAGAESNGKTAEDDDDPFGLGTVATKPASRFSGVDDTQQSAGADDDVLGLLGKPVSEIEQDQRKNDRKNKLPEYQPEPPSDEPPKSDDPRDRAVAELVDMGFPADRSRKALTETSNGFDIQAAVGILLNRAHEEARQKSRGASPHGGGTNSVPEVPDSAMPTWMRSDASRGNSRSSSTQRRQDNHSPSGEKDVAQYASDFGTNLFKSANTLWKSGQKRVQRVVADLQQDQDSSQPKWMREARLQAEVESKPTSAREGNHQAPIGHARAPKKAVDVTDEALMLESDQARPQKPFKAQPSPARTPIDSPRTMSPTQGLSTRPSLSQRTSSQQQQRRPERDAKAHLSKQAIEEQSSQAYVSPARRRKPKPVEDL